MDFSQILMTAAAQSAGKLPPELNPDPAFALGSTGWTNGGGDAVINTGSVVFTNGSFFTSLVAPTGANLTALNASVPDNTPLAVRLTVTGWTSGTLLCQLKGGAFVDLLVTGNGTFTRTVTSAASAALGDTSVRGDTASTMTLTYWSIKVS